MQRKDAEVLERMNRYGESFLEASAKVFDRADVSQGDAQCSMAYHVEGSSTRDCQKRKGHAPPCLDLAGKWDRSAEFDRAPWCSWAYGSRKRYLCCARPEGHLEPHQDRNQRWDASKEFQPEPGPFQRGKIVKAMNALALLAVLLFAPFASASTSNTVTITTDTTRPVPVASGNGGLSTAATGTKVPKPAPVTPPTNLKGTNTSH